LLLFLLFGFLSLRADAADPALQPGTNPPIAKNSIAALHSQRSDPEVYHSHAARR
jgi:hypothetical protein